MESVHEELLLFRKSRALSCKSNETPFLTNGNKYFRNIQRYDMDVCMCIYTAFALLLCYILIAFEYSKKEIKNSKSCYSS